MNDLIMAERAKYYIDMLTRGLNPVTGEELKEDSPINNVRITRSLQYVSDILRQVIENGGRVGGRATKKDGLENFFLEAERRSEVRYSSAPLKITRFMARVNELRDKDKTKKLPATAVTGWLDANGYLKLETDENGRKSRLPTERGEDLGISERKATASSGEYTAVYYDENAQRFIVDNLDAIISAYYAE